MEDLLVKLWLFWIAGGIDAVICAIILAFFFLGLVNGTVSSFNIRIWIAMLATLASIMGGSLWLKMHGHPVCGTMLLLVVAIPGLLYGAFIVLLMVTKTSWN